MARCFGDAPVLMRTLANRQDLSRKYLHALLTVLKSAGLVRSVRGPGGGFVLTRPPAQIRLSEVLDAVEGPLSLVDCVADRRVCGRARRCAARRVWRELSGAMKDMLDTVTLEDIVAPEQKACSSWRGNKKRRKSHRKRGATVPSSSSTSCGPRTKGSQK